MIAAHLTPIPFLTLENRSKHVRLAAEMMDSLIILWSESCLMSGDIRSALGVSESDWLLLTTPLGLKDGETLVHLVDEGEPLCDEYEREDGRLVHPSEASAAAPCSACDGGVPVAPGVGAAAAPGRPAARVELPGLVGPVEISRTEAVALGAVALAGVGRLALALS